MRRMFWLVFAGCAAVIVGPAVVPAATTPAPAGVVCETVPAEPGAEICAHVPGHVWDGTDWVPATPAPMLPATS